MPEHETIDQYSTRELIQIADWIASDIADWIASDGLLRTDEELIRDIFGTLPFQRMGNRIRERLEKVAVPRRQRR
jgi:hypothetical protein